MTASSPGRTRHSSNRSARAARGHEWAFAAASWRERHGLSSGETNLDSEVVEETVRNTEATVMGRHMFSGGEGRWEDDPNADAWWGDEPPFGHPVFVLTHHAREPLAKHGGTTFTSSPPGSKPRSNRPGRRRERGDVLVAGDANVIQQFLGAHISYRVVS